MTKETSTTDSQEAPTPKAPANVTVFSDGSTFDYENGYQSNGAPVATRDRTDNPRIVKTHKIFTLNLLLALFAWGLTLVLILGLVAAAVSISHSAENWKALKAGVNDSGQVEVVGSASPNNLIVKRPDGSVFKCDVAVVSKDDVPTGFVFCGAGAPANFSIPLPHNPNVFIDAPEKEH